jgi:hypothetical protein
MPKATVQQMQPAPEFEKYETYAAIAASKLDLNNLDLEERAFLGTCQDLYRNARGCATPFETFVRNIIRWTTWGNSPKPQDLIDEIRDEFQEDFDLTLHSVQRFMLNHPDAVSELTFPPAPLDPPAASETITRPARKPAKAQRTRKKVARA